MDPIVYDNIGTGYNSYRQADPFLSSRLLHLLAPRKDQFYLDIGCGTGNYTIALSEKELKFCGVEPSEKMLSVARSRCSHIEWLNGCAEQIPVSDNTFHGAIATLTMHHWKDLQQAFSELYRVTRTGARIVLFTATPEQMRGYWLNHYFPRMMEESILQMPALNLIFEAGGKAGFDVQTIEKYWVQDTLCDHFLYVGKNRPEVYFNDVIRNGISSFASLANHDEVWEGLAQLHTDLDKGVFDNIRQQYEHDEGDYLFICMEKKTDDQLKIFEKR